MKRVLRLTAALACVTLVSGLLVAPVEASPVFGSQGTVTVGIRSDGDVDLFNIDVATGAETKLFNTDGDEVDPDWNADGTLLAYSDNRAQSIVIATPEGAFRRTITRTQGVKVRPKFSPDGRTVMFGRSTGSERGLWMVDVATGVERPLLVTPDGPNRHGVFSPNGTTVFASCELWDPTPFSDICSINLTTGEIRRLTMHPGIDSGTNVSPDGKRVTFYSQRSGGNDIYSMDTDGNNLQRLTSNPYNDVGTSWSPDGKRIAFTSDRHSLGALEYDLGIMNADGSDQHVVYRGGRVTYPSWRPEPASGYRIIQHNGHSASFGASSSRPAWVSDAAGYVTGVDGTPTLGDRSGRVVNAPIVGAVSTPIGLGYWLPAADGGIFSYGDAGFFGSMGSRRLNKPIVGMAPTPVGLGYWMVATDGGVFSFGDAAFHGSTGAMRLNSPIVGMAATPSGNGYWLVASDGGVFSFGDAKFYGSTGGRKLNQPIVSITPNLRGDGYWLTAKDGGVFAFGNADFQGSAVGKLSGPAVGMTVSAG